MKSGEIIRVRTNAELLNELMGTNYKAWMKSVFDFYNGKRIWMVHIDNKPRNDWKNYMNCNVIIEENLRPEDLRELRIDPKPNIERIVFSKNSDYFIFEGIYRYDKERSRADRIRYWVKVSDEF